MKSLFRDDDDDDLPFEPTPDQTENDDTFEEDHGVFISVRRSRSSGQFRRRRRGDPPSQEFRH